MEKDKAKQIIAFYQREPIRYFTDCLDVKPENVWGKMIEIVESVRDNKKTAVKAGHSVSKSYTASRTALWFLYCFYPATVITTAPSHPQVEQILWREIRNAHAQAKVPLGGQVTKTKIELAEKWFAYGFATKPDTVTQQATRFQGFHNDNVLIIFDEAAGIMREIWEAKDALLTSGHCRFLAIGNPTTARGDFPNCFKDPTYSKITISVKDTPNYIEGREVIKGVSGREYAEETARKYGDTSNYYKARVLGEIPDEDVDVLIPLAWIEKAENRAPYNNYRFVKKFVTWDVADGGDDKHVIKGWDNKTEINEIVLRDKKIEEAEPYVWRLLREIGGNCIIYDGDGLGRVAGGLLNATKDEKTTVIAFLGSAEAYVPTDFANRKAEGYWACRSDFEKNIISISYTPEQREELGEIKLAEHSKGVIAIEKKKDLKERLGRSPDYADGIMMMSACFDEVPVVEKKRDRYVRETTDYDYNPNTV